MLAELTEGLFEPVSVAVQLIATGSRIPSLPIPSIASSRANSSGFPIGVVERSCARIVTVLKGYAPAERAGLADPDGVLSPGVVLNRERNLLPRWLGRH